MGFGENAKNKKMTKLSRPPAVNRDWTIGRHSLLEAFILLHDNLINSIKKSRIIFVREIAIEELQERHMVS